MASVTAALTQVPQQGKRFGRLGLRMLACGGREPRPPPSAGSLSGAYRPVGLERQRGAPIRAVPCEVESVKFRSELGMSR